MPLKRIALFGKRNTHYDYFMLSGLATGFQALGLEVVFHPRLLDAAQLKDFCAHFQPDAVLEINRTREYAPGLPAAVRHITWLQDPPLPAMSNSERSESDLTYYLISPETLGFTPPKTGSWGYLFTGVDERTAHPGDDPPLSDFSIIAFMPKPFQANPISQLRFGPRQTALSDVFQAFSERYWAAYTGEEDPPVQYDAFIALFSDTLLRMTGLTLVQIAPDEPMRSDISEIVLLICRSMGRRKMTDAVLAVSQSTRLFGQPTWLKWSEYAPYYQGSLNRHADVCQAFRTTRLNLHNNISGLSMHSRVLDCMACGAPILVESSPYDDLEFGINHFFQPDEHYIPFSFNTLEATARRWLEDPAGRHRLGQEAAQETLARHSWKARATQIVNDLEHL